jgi:uncharacterized protein (TIGR04255 family)
MMPTNRTIARPADLADYTSPPVTEVVLGVQFNSLERFLAPHLGLVWGRFRSDFPNIVEHPPLFPTFETFGSHPQFFPAMGLQIAAADMPRVFFINEDRTQLLQLQKDRFLHNWRKIAAGGEYPRFERMLETFEIGFKTVIDVLAEEKLGTVIPNQCEVSYINQIPVLDGESVYDTFNKVFAHQSASMILDDLGGAPEDLRLLLRYIIRDENSAPAGRVIISADPARRADGVTIIQLTLTARGIPPTPDSAGLVNFLGRGRLHIVRAFTNLTSEQMHKEWGRTQ